MTPSHRTSRNWLRRQGPVVQALALAVGAFLIGYLVTWLLFFPGWDRDAIVTVPDLTGKPFRTAERLAKGADLQLRRGTVLPHPRIAANGVLAQTPLPGREVTRGSEVRVVVSGGPDLRPIPALTDLDAAGAASLLRLTGFRVKAVEVASDRPAGSVVSVTPESGKSAPAGSDVVLGLSKGPPPVIVPSGIGLVLGAARELFGGNGLRTGKLSYDATSTVALGTVLAQTPAAGSSTPRGTAVALTVAGPAPAPPPPVAPAPDSVPAEAAPAAPVTP